MAVVEGALPQAAPAALRERDPAPADGHARRKSEGRKTPDTATSYAPWHVFNIGNNKPVELMRYIEVLENCLGKKARLDLLPMQPGDVPATYANTDALDSAVGFRPDTPVETGVANFVKWYREYYNVQTDTVRPC